MFKKLFNIVENIQGQCNSVISQWVVFTYCAQRHFILGIVHSTHTSF